MFFCKDTTFQLNYDTTQQLCLKIINQRKKELNDSNLSAFLRSLRYIVHDNNQLDKLIFDFVKNIIYQYPDRNYNIDLTTERDIGMDAINAGINSIRGIAVEFMIDCYTLPQYKDEIFDTLEFVADNANEITRACIIYNGAWLNNLDKQRAFDLYLRLVKDYNPILLAIPFHDGHPLLYHMNNNFKKLVSFFSKAITIEEAGKPMAFFLFNAYLNNRPNAFSLLKTLLNNNSQARQELVWIICTHILNDEKHSKKGWRVLNYLLHFNDEKLGEKFNNSFLHIPPKTDSMLTNFINNYLTSPICTFKSNYFYDFIRKLIPEDSRQCLEWFFESKPDCFKHNFYDTSPLNVLIEAYNGIREYERDEPILEKAMDTFDLLLQIPQYRNVHLRTFLKELSS